MAQHPRPLLLHSYTTGHISTLERPNAHGRNRNGKRTTPLVIHLDQNRRGSFFDGALFVLCMGGSSAGSSDSLNRGLAGTLTFRPPRPFSRGSWCAFEARDPPPEVDISLRNSSRRDEEPAERDCTVSALLSMKLGGIGFSLPELKNSRMRRELPYSHFHQL